MAFAILFSRILGLIRDAVLSAQFGIRFERDAYVAAFVIPDLLFFLLAGGALSSAFIPVFGSYWAKGEREEAWKVFSSLVTLMAFAVFFFVVFAEIFAPQLVAIFTPGLSFEKQALAADLSRVLLPSQFGFLLGGLMFGTMNAQKHFLVPALAPNIYNLGIILGASVLAPLLSVPIFGPAWGALAGALVGNLLIPIWVMNRFGAKYEFRLDWKHEGVQRVFRMMLPVVLGLSLPGVYAIITRAFGSFFEEGAISALDIGNRIMQAPLGIFGQALAIAVFPTLIEMYAHNKKREFLETASKSVRTVIFIGLIVGGIMFVMSEDIVRVLNQWGTFTSQNTKFVAEGLRMYSLGVFAWCAHPILMRAFFAMENTITPVFLGTITTFFLFSLCAFFLKIGVGYSWYALAVSLSAIFLMTLLLIGLKIRLGRFDGTKLLRVLGVGVVSTVLISLLIALGTLVVPFPEIIPANLISFVRLFLFGLGGLWIYLKIGNALGLEEAGYALRAISKRQPAPPPEISP